MLDDQGFKSRKQWNWNDLEKTSPWSQPSQASTSSSHGKRKQDKDSDDEKIVKLELKKKK